MLDRARPRRWCWWRTSTRRSRARRCAGSTIVPPVAALGTTGVEAIRAAVARAAAAAPRARRRPAARHLHLRQRGGARRASCSRTRTASGTTSRSRRRCLSRRTTSCSAMLPQFHVAGWNCQPLLAWWVGATVVLERSFQPARALQLIADRRVTAMMGVPTQYAMLAADRDWAATDTSSLRLALVGGATVPAELQQTWTDHGMPLTQGYGLTEAAPNVLHLPAARGRRQPGCGRSAVSARLGADRRPRVGAGPRGRGDRRAVGARPERLRRVPRRRARHGGRDERRVAAHRRPRPSRCRRRLPRRRPAQGHLHLGRRERRARRGRVRPGAASADRGIRRRGGSRSGVG